MSQQHGTNDPLVRSYRGLRFAGGIIGIALPWILALGNLALVGPGLESSISGYYHTCMRDVFVGGLCAIAVFLLACSGYDRKDAIAGDLACAFAVGAALFPIAPDRSPTPQQEFVGGLHMLFAAGFFVTLSVFALVLFRKTEKKGAETQEKKRRNAVYTVCGITMVCCLVLIGIVKCMASGWAESWFAPVFWLEAIAISAFGFCWIVKGEALLGDPGGPRPWPAALERLRQRRS